MNKHTPGPWSKFVWNQSQPGILTIGARKLSGVRDHICHVDASGGDKEMEANARLIVAAPDIFEALKLILEREPSIGIGTKLAIAALIAKAEGRDE